MGFDFWYMLREIRTVEGVGEPRSNSEALTPHRRLESLSEE
jgi:hypothetical protein